MKIYIFKMSKNEEYAMNFSVDPLNESSYSERGYNSNRQKISSAALLGEEDAESVPGSN